MQILTNLEVTGPVTAGTAVEADPILATPPRAAIPQQHVEAISVEPRAPPAHLGMDIRLRELPGMHQGAHDRSQLYGQGLNGLGAHLAPALEVCSHHAYRAPKSGQSLPCMT